MRRSLAAFAPSAFAGLVFLCAGTARGDTVSMKDGRELEGTVVEESDKTVHLRVVRGKQSVVIELARSEVKEVKKTTIDPVKLEAEAQQALAAGQKEDALRILERLVAEKPGDAKLRRDLAFAELMSDDVKSAKQDYSRAVALDSLDIEALMGLGYCCAKTDDRDAAIEAYRKATGAGPRHLKAWLELARLLLARGKRLDVDEAVRAGKEAQRVSPGSAEAALIVAEAYGKTTGAGSDEDRKRALPVLEAYMKDHASEPEVLRVARRAGEVALAQNEPARAATALAGLIRAQPPVTHEEREALLALEALYDWIAKGRTSPALGIDIAAEKLDLEAAARRFDAAVAVAPGEGEILLARARLSARRGHLVEAADTASRAEKALAAGASRDDAALLVEALRKLARAALAVGPAAPPIDADKDPAPSALAHARRLAELLPFAPSAHEDLARLLEASGDFAKSRDEFQRARDLAPEPEKKRLEDEAKRVEAIRARRERNKDL